MLLLTRGRIEFNPREYHQPFPKGYHQPLAHEEQAFPDDRGTHCLGGYWWIQPHAGHQFSASQIN